MATNLIELVTREFGGETLGKLAGLLGEPEGKVQAAVGGVAPALVAELLRANVDAVKVLPGVRDAFVVGRHRHARVVVRPAHREVVVAHHPPALAAVVAAVKAVSGCQKKTVRIMG